MQKQSFLALSLILGLFLSSCTKDDPDFNHSSNQTGTAYQEPYVVSYSNWTTDASVNWSDGATTEPSRQFDLSVPELTQEELATGSFVLLYARSNADGSVQPMPAAFTDVNNDDTNNYSAVYSAGAISFSHTRFVNGTYETPNDSNEISFRYIIVRPNTPDPNGRPITSDDLLNKSYYEVIRLLGIPE